MEDAASNGNSIQSDGADGSHRVIVSDLVALIEHVEASIKLIEATVVAETPLGNQELSGNVVVLDDVSPRYARVNAALDACNSSLRVALHFLRDSRTSRQEVNQSAESGRGQIRLIVRG